MQALKRPYRTTDMLKEIGKHNDKHEFDSDGG
jgi:hypothetical protein